MCSCNVQNHKNFILAYFTDIVIIFHVDKPLKNVDIDLLECKGQEYVTIITISFLPTFYNLYAQQHIMQFVERYILCNANDNMQRTTNGTCTLTRRKGDSHRSVYLCPHPSNFELSFCRDPCLLCPFFFFLYFSFGHCSLLLHFIS